MLFKREAHVKPIEADYYTPKELELYRYCQGTAFSYNHSSDRSSESHTVSDSIMGDLRHTMAHGGSLRSR